jgi:hypothetical protein
MFHFKMLSAALLAASLLVPAASLADTSRAPCIFKEHSVTSVTPYRVQERVGRGTVTRLKGAQVYVRAEPGLTKEWLQLTLTRHLAAMQGPAAMKDCAFEVEKVKVEVNSAGAGFVVRLVAPDTSTAKEVLRRAELLRS